ncbi:MAG: hypothetical protein AAFZ07_10970 [Actinomycetota bacterium]
MDAAVSALRSGHERGDSIDVVHYACENLHNATARPPAVGAIAIHNLDSQTTQLFTRTESRDDPASQKAEADLLERFLAHLQSSSGTQYVHWNMSRAQYGFEAIAARYRHLTGKNPPGTAPESSRHNLDDLIKAEYGDQYATHPRMSTLLQVNGLRRRYALDGPDEASKLDEGDFGAIDRSVTEKVERLAALFVLLVSGRLETLTSAGKLDFAGGKVDAVEVIRRLGERLLYVQREMAKRHGGRAGMEFNDEYDDQDLFRSLLRIFFEDVRPEDYVPEYAGGASRVDFVLPDFSVAIELKHCRDSHTSKTIGEELTIDAKRYAVHPNARHLVCIVIDHEGRLSNPRGLESDLAAGSTQEGLAVTVAIIDR